MVILTLDALEPPSELYVPCSFNVASSFPGIIGWFTFVVNQPRFFNLECECAPAGALPLNNRLLRNLLVALL